MDADLEDRLITRDTVAEVAPAATAVWPDAEVEGWTFDATVLVPAAAGATIAQARALARALRGGRDFDPSLPADWHVRGFHEPTGDEPRTAIALSRTFRAPDGYDET